MAKRLRFQEIVGVHPTRPHKFGGWFKYEDAHSNHGVPSRQLNESNRGRSSFITTMREWLRTHHSHPEHLARRREALTRQGFTYATKRFPTNSDTQKGNWAEIFLAEYVSAACNAQLPVYRLRYNPNIEQSMTGNDVLAFDLDSDPIRIIVGEAKFRGTPSKQAVVEIVETLERQHRAGVPVSLQFVADRLFEEGKADLGSRIEECSYLFARGKLRLDHVGLLVSNQKALNHVKKNAESSMRRLAIMSLCLDDPIALVQSSFESLEDSL